MPTPADILTAIAPEMVAVDPAVRDVHLELAENQTGSVFGSARNHAVALLAAHGMTLATREGMGGQVVSRKEGDLSVGFGAAGREASPLGATSYGVELERLRRSYIMGARNALV